MGQNTADSVRLLVAMLTPRLVSRGASAAWVFLEQTTGEPPEDDLAIIEAFRLLPEWLGQGPVAPTESECGHLERSGLRLPIRRMGLGELAQVVFLASVLRRLRPARAVAVAEGLWTGPEVANRAAVLRALLILVDQENWVEFVQNGTWKDAPHLRGHGPRDGEDVSWPCSDSEFNALLATVVAPPGPSAHDGALGRSSRPEGMSDSSALRRAN